MKMFSFYLSANDKKYFMFNDSFLLLFLSFFLNLSWFLFCIKKIIFFHLKTIREEEKRKMKRDKKYTKEFSCKKRVFHGS